MFKVMVCGLDEKISYVSFFSRNEQDANIEFNRACHIAERDANRNNKVDVRIDLVCGVAVLKSFTPEIKGETK